jgi:hypothetical protein
MFQPCKLAHKDVFVVCQRVFQYSQGRRLLGLSYADLSLFPVPFGNLAKRNQNREGVEFVSPLKRKSSELTNTNAEKVEKGQEEPQNVESESSSSLDSPYIDTFEPAFSKQDEVAVSMDFKVSIDMHEFVPLPQEKNHLFLAGYHFLLSNARMREHYDEIAQIIQEYGGTAHITLTSLHKA